MLKLSTYDENLKSCLSSLLGLHLFLFFIGNTCLLIWPPGYITKAGMEARLKSLPRVQHSFVLERNVGGLKEGKGPWHPPWDPVPPSSLLRHACQHAADGWHANQGTHSKTGRKETSSQTKPSTYPNTAWPSCQRFTVQETYPLCARAVHPSYKFFVRQNI